jgi:hypothetical protein
MLTDKQQIKLLEKKVKDLEKKMLFVIEMIGAPDAKSFDRNVKEEIEIQEEALTAHYKNLGWPITSL